MNVSKAIKKSNKANVKILTQKALTTIKHECKLGKYNTKIQLMAMPEELDGINNYYYVNNHVIKNLHDLGYQLGSQEQSNRKRYLNVFWNFDTKQI